MKSLVSALGVLCFSLSAMATPATLRSKGAVGDGVTDDRAAIEKALKDAAGTPLDGEGLTYAVQGTVSVSVDVDLRNVILKQTQGSWDASPYIRSAASQETPQVKPAEALTKMVKGLPWLRYDGVATYPEDPVVTGDDLKALREMLNLRTLFIHGRENQPVSIRLEKVQVLRGHHADAGMHSNSAGLYLVDASPVTLTDIEITGDGKGAGLFVHRCRKVRMDRLNIHDILWAPYRGDMEFTAAVLGGDFGWNNSPIYDFDERAGRFMRVRVQEQLTGMTIGSSDDVEITNSRIERIGTKVDGKFLPWQADGVTVSGVKNLVMRDCVITSTWEGIDLTGQGVDGFVQENIRISDSFAYGFKYAHPQKNGKVINCVSEHAAYRSFTIGAECENIEFIHCVARETGSKNYWRREGRERNGIYGFELGFQEDASPQNITFKDCRAENVAFPTTMECGFGTSDRAAKPELNIRLIHPKVVGATLRAVDGFRVVEEAP
ncbi:N terminal extension of bacteriophage endosialidase [Prosthecobacter debontii]|uniref:N terminal extension of bacteriophage endosialidase n=1 Tax=Prosthecobacter debontii TaxID=48467 RepID=A0A1T4XS31_9BACT|nr:right-handed parallel beta-helix repeat-containing protein [Prosthecobacter debontii]SKA92359.1 N terminal extension of bacteriophage endosialidase [Prosthecobacter debontii]